MSALPPATVGANCPDGRCGDKDIGSGHSIHGANSVPDVITVAAVTIGDRRLGDSSQGPGGLSKRKPDLAGYSHFLGSEVEARETPAAVLPLHHLWLPEPWSLSARRRSYRLRR